ncbi:hypothetical protein [Streptomyces flaveus]|uniref:hypothetical protein n=1 Tax=Streptomyces flaveus TaxID=66370 RepID=UPI00166F6B58|nr:hypothetical protein [Streptomyces flaveus]
MPGAQALAEVIEDSRIESGERLIRRPKLAGTRTPARIAASPSAMSLVLIR